MKKYLFLFAGFTFSAAQSQEITDALRYSQDNLMEQLVSELWECIWRSWWRLSSLNVNPAGSAILT
jgi:hypothetical protein